MDAAYPYDAGQSISLAVAFTTKVGAARDVAVADTGQTIHNVRGDLVDPAEVYLVLRDGKGQERIAEYGELLQPYTITQDATGVYYAKVLLDEPGRWTGRWEGDPGGDTSKVSYPFAFDVRPAAVLLSGAP